MQHNHIRSWLEAQRTAAADRLGASLNAPLGNARHMRAAVEWLSAAQDATPDGGVAAIYSLRSGWAASYPETTGYIIPTLLAYADYSGQAACRGRAVRMANWLLSIQLSEGGFPAPGTVDVPYVFDAGQIIFGLLAIYAHSGEQVYLNSAIRAAHWLEAVQDESGAWVRHSYGGQPHAYHSRAAWALLEAYRVTNDDRLRRAALRSLTWGFQQQQENGWFANNTFPGEQAPTVHTIAYAARGLLEGGQLLQEERYIQAAVKTAAALRAALPDDGLLPGRFDRDWRPVVRWSCLTGSAQTAIIWLRLYDITGDRAWLQAAQQANTFLKRTQDTHAKNPTIRGAIRGSYPIDGGYVTYGYPNWAAKFFIDALLLEERANDR